MQVREGTETSFALVSNGGRVVSTFDEAGELRARAEATTRGLALFRLTTRAERVVP